MDGYLDELDKIESILRLTNEAREASRLKEELDSLNEELESLRKKLEDIAGLTDPHNRGGLLERFELLSKKKLIKILYKALDLVTNINDISDPYSNW